MNWTLSHTNARFGEDTNRNKSARQFAMNNEKKLLSLQSSLRELDPQSSEQCLEAAKLKIEIADVFISLSLENPAIRKFDHAARMAMQGFEELQRLGGADSLKAKALQCLGIADWHLKGPAKAVIHFAKCRAITSENTGLTLNQRITAEDNLALALHETGSTVQAIEHQKAALELARKGNDLRTINRITRRLANLYQDTGYFQLSRTLLESIRPTRHTVDEDQVAWFNAAALLAEKEYRTSEAIQYYEEGLSFFRKMKSPQAPMASILSNAALLFTEVGRHNEAEAILDEYERLVPTRSTLNAQLGLLRLRACIALDNHEPELAERHWQRAARLVEENGGNNPLKLSSISTTRARLLWKLGQHKKALHLLRPFALPATRQQTCGEGTGEFRLAPTICLGQYLLELDQTDEASRLLHAAFELETGIQHSDEEWRLLSALANLAYARDKRRSAILLGKLAVQKICQLTASMQEAQAEYDAFLKSKIEPFQTLIDRLIEDIRYPEASYILAMSKSEQIFEFAKRDLTLDYCPPSPPMRYDEEPLLINYDRLCKQSRAVRNQFRDRGLQTHNGPAASNKKQMAMGKPNELLTHIFSEKWAAQDVNPSCPPPRKKGNEEIASLYFFKTRNTMTAFVSTGHENRQYVISEDADALSRMVFALRHAIDRQARDLKTLATRLYELVLRPAEPILGHIKRLEIMATGPLAHLPFSCLMTNNRFLVEDFVIAYRTGIESSAHRSGKVADGECSGQKVAAFGAVHPRIQSPPLPHIEMELAAIKASCPDARIFSNRNFTAGNIEKALQKGITLMHIASHFHLVPAASHRSTLLLGDGTFLSMADLRNDRFDFSSLELLVLSGCDTATAEHGLHGVESLAGLAHMKGARHVIGTLWPIADIGAASMMHNFYKTYFDQSGKTDAAQCLSHAQKMMISGNSKSTEDAPSSTRGFGKSSKRDTLTHPFFWAGFSVFISGR